MSVVVPYRQMPPEAKCPFCGETHGMLETTDTPGTYKYTCWCGATSTCTATDEEIQALRGPP